MARRDIAGLLTGIPSSGGGSVAEVMTQGARQMGGLMGRYGRGVFTGDVRSNEQRLADDIKNFGSATPEAQKDLIGRLQASGQSSVAAQLLGQLKAPPKVNKKIVNLVNTKTNKTAGTATEVDGQLFNSQGQLMSPEELEGFGISASYVLSLIHI